MRTKHELSTECAKTIKALRTKAGLSKAKMADLLYIDDHTYSKYEDGKSMPSVVDFIAIFEALGENPMPYILNILYPDANNRAGKSIPEMRDGLCRYFGQIAADRTIRATDFLIYGSHGSSASAQLEMMLMLNHLPMQYKCIVARLIDGLYDMAVSRGEITNPDMQMPEVDVFKAALARGECAANSKKDGYTSITE